MAVKDRPPVRAHAGGVQIRLAAKAENVALVRHALAGAAQSLGMSDDVLVDLKTVVTEACMNVVAHAYGEEPGPLEVQSWQEGDEMVIVVRDQGSGIRPQAEAGHQSLRLGMSLIAAMTSGFEISGGSGRGTSVTMRLPLRDAEPVASSPPPGGSFDLDEGAVVLTAWDGVALPAILARVVSVLASRTGMSVDELSDAVLFGDVISHDLASLDGAVPVQVKLSAGEGNMSLKVGPLPAGAASELRQGLYLPEEIGGSLEKLAEEVRVEENSEGEFLHARFESDSSA